MDGNFRDRLSVYNKDPNFVYRWVLDTDSSGARIHWMRQAGWELSPNDVQVGGSRMATSKEETTTARVPANRQGEYHYLMRIKKEWYDEDQAKKAEQIKLMDRQIHTQRDVDGVRLYNDDANETSTRLDTNPAGR
jgi:hypothetical protein